MARLLLLADDSVTIQRVIEMTFGNEGFDVIAANNGQEALDALADRRPDVILADANMPVLDGYELCERVKLDPATRDIPVILLKGAYEEFDLQRAEAVGMDDYVTKPFDSRKLIERVQSLMTAGEGPAVDDAAQPIEMDTTEIDQQRIAETAGDPFADFSGDSEVDAAFDDTFGAMTESEAADDEEDRMVEEAFAAFDVDEDEGEAEHTLDPAPTTPVAAMSVQDAEDQDAEDQDEEDQFDAAFEGEIDAALDRLTSFDDEDEPVTKAAPAAAAPTDTTVQLPPSGDQAVAAAAPAEAPDGQGAFDLDLGAFDEQPADFDEVVFEAEQTDSDRAADPFRTTDSLTQVDATEEALDSAADLDIFPVGDHDAEEDEEAFLDEAEAEVEARDAGALEALIEERIAEMFEEHLDELIDRLADRLTDIVVERLGEHIRSLGIEESAKMILEKIGWDVVPDLAELVVREEIRRIKEQAGMN